MNTSNLLAHSAPFIGFLEEWLANLPDMTLAQAAPHPKNAAIICVDVTNGFCVEGALASPRIGKKIIPPIVELFQKAWDYGIRNIVLPNDAHEPDAVEFLAYPPHTICGTHEAEPVDDIKALPFYQHLLQLPKNSISAGLNAGFNKWVSAHPNISDYLVTGDCTDLCVYQLALYLRVDANERQLNRRVIVPASCVDTFDRSVETAQREGGLPHDADLLHAVFLYHMALNGIEVVRGIEVES